MKKRRAAFGLLLVFLVTSLGFAVAEGFIRDLAASEADTTSAEIVWNCTYKEEQLYTLAYRPEGVERYATRGTYDTYYRVNYLLPGTTYELTVSTPDGDSESITFTTPAANDYIGYHYRLLDVGVYRSFAGEKDYTAFSSLNSKTLPGEVYGYDFSFMFQFKLTASEEDKSLDCLLILRLPNGDFYSMSEIFWYTLRSATSTQYFPFTELLEDILSDYGGFPVGEYTLTAYFEGGFAAETTFIIT